MSGFGFVLFYGGVCCVCVVGCGVVFDGDGCVDVCVVCDFVMLVFVFCVCCGLGLSVG